MIIVYIIYVPLSHIKEKMKQTFILVSKKINCEFWKNDENTCSKQRDDGTLRVWYKKSTRPKRPKITPMIHLTSVYTLNFFPVKIQIIEFTGNNQNLKIPSFDRRKFGLKHCFSIKRPYLGNYLTKCLHIWYQGTTSQGASNDSVTQTQTYQKFEYLTSKIS